jgi:hypothetical protein
VLIGDLLLKPSFHLAVSGTRAAIISSDAAHDYLNLVDVSSPTAPVLTGSVVIGPPGTGKGVVLLGTAAYVAANTQGLQIYDAIFATPVLRAVVDTVGSAVDLAIEGPLAYVADPPSTVSVIDLGGSAPPPTPGAMGIAGLIHYYSNPSLAVNGAVVQLRNMTAGTITATAQTNASGQYAFSGLSGGNWQVQPLKNGNAGSAIDILDAVAILQATVGTRTLSPQQHIACDVSGDNSVNIIDAVLIMQYTVGLISRFPVAQTCNSDWAFVPEPAPAANQQILAPLISTTTCRNGAIGFNPLAAQADNQNFSAVLFGDCTGNWQPSGSGAAAALVAADTANGVRIGQYVQSSGGRFRVPVSVTTGSFRGLTAEIRYDPTQFTAFRVRPVRRAHSALMEANLQVPGLVKVVMASARPLPKGAAFVLEFASKQGQAGTPQVRIQRTVIAR